MKAKDLVAAIKHKNGEIWVGFRHALCHENARTDLGFEKYLYEDFTDGFQHKDGAFLNRAEAAGALGFTGGYLKSEDLPYL